MQINFALKEVNCKIVYYGPGLSGKTTNLEVIHSKAPTTNRGELTSIATEGDRTLFFDFLPLNLGNVAGMKTKFQLYTVPGQVFYNSTRKLVLQGVDGVVFVADSRRGKLEENTESLENLKENMAEYGLTLQTTPFVIQYNKRDLEDIHTVEELDRALNTVNAPTVEASALTGEGVFPTLKKLAGMVLENLNRQQSSSVVRRRMLAKEPVAAGVKARAGEAAAAPSTPSAPSRPAGRAASEQPAVVKEHVASGVKPVERRVPPKGASGVKPRVTPRRENASGRPAASPAARDVAQGERPAAGSRAALYIVLTLVVLGGAAAALYYTGVLGKLLG
ncbi:MAG TPA: GTPase [Planctomycetes bacterium]|nr:GTPase [Planctomycetota bacterium]